ncbi:MAG TPA: SpoIIE family protein phosphatase [Coriobacteriia bacterium]
MPRRELLSKALNDLNSTVLSIFDVPDHMRSILGDACAALGATAAFIEMREGEHLAVRHAVGLSEELLRMPLSLAGMIAEQAKRRRDVVPLDTLDDDVAAAVRRLDGEGVTSALAVPLTVTRDSSGVMVFFGSEPFDEHAQDFARKLATSVSLALRAAELFEAEGRRAVLAEALDRINCLVHARLEPSEVLSVALEEGCAVLSAANGCVLLSEEDRWVIRHQWGTGRRLIGDSFTPIWGSIRGDLRDTKEPMVLRPGQDDRFDPADVARYHVGVLLVVPIVSKDDIVGAALFNRTAPGATFTSAEVDFGRRLGASASLAHENARLYQVQLEAARLSERLRSIDDTLHSTLEFDDIVREALAVGAQAIGAVSSALAFHEDDLFRVAYAQGFATDISGTEIPATKEAHSLLALATREAVIVDDVRTDTRCDAEHMASYGVRSQIVAPLIVRDEPTANLYYSFDRPHRFTESEVEFVTRIASSLSLALRNAQQYDAERTIAQTLQEALLALPAEVPGVQVAHVYHSAALQARVGGDFYDVFELDHGHLGLVVGDVSGKGLDAAVLTALVKNTIRAHAVEKRKTPADVLSCVNTVLLKESRPETFVTAFFAMLDRRDGRLVYCNAGHPAAVVLHEDGVAQRLAPNSPITGAFANAPFANGEAQVGIDDLIFLYTDGLTEARHEHELYGEERLFVQLAGVCDTGPDEAIRRVVEDVVAFARGQLVDDVAVLAVKRVPLPTDAPVQQKLPLWSLR